MRNPLTCELGDAAMSVEAVGSSSPMRRLSGVSMRDAAYPVWF